MDGLMSVCQFNSISSVKRRTSVDDLPAMKICQPVQNTLCYLAQDFLSRPSAELLDFLVYTVETAALAKLHGNGYRPSRLIHEGTVVATDMLRGTILVEIELAHNLLLHIWVGVRSDDLFLASSTRVDMAGIP